jgi:hypothetical protein
MSFNGKDLILLICAVTVLVLPLFFHLTYGISPITTETLLYHIEHENPEDADYVNTQNNLLGNYFNSVYDSQVSNVECKYKNGVISQKEMDKELNSIQNNNHTTTRVLNDLNEFNIDLTTRNITKEDFLIQKSSLKYINSDLKTEVHSVLEGY